MTPEVVMDLFANAFYLAVLVISVIVGPSLAVGLLVSMFQAATQINEQTLSFLPRLLVTLITIMVTGAWLIEKFSGLFGQIFKQIPILVGA